MPVVTVGEQGTFKIGTLGGVLVSVYRGPPVVEHLALIEQAQTAFAAARGKVATLAIVAAEKLEAPGPGMRDAAAALQKKLEPLVICSAVVITSKGLAAVIARTFFAAYQLLVHHQTPYSTFRELQPALEWIRANSPAGTVPEGALAELEAFVAAPSRS